MNLMTCVNCNGHTFVIVVGNPPHGVEPIALPYYALCTGCGRELVKLVAPEEQEEEKP